LAAIAKVKAIAADVVYETDLSVPSTQFELDGQQDARASKNWGNKREEAQLVAATCRVLLIDADTTFAASVRDELVRQGCECATAPSATAGLHRALEFHPDVIVVDAALPDRPGTDVLRAVRSAKDERVVACRVVLSTATPSDADRLHAAIEGALDYVAKPIGPKELARRVRACVDLGPEPTARRRIQVTALRVLAAMEADGSGRGDVPNPFDVAEAEPALARRGSARSTPSGSGGLGTDLSMPNVLLAATVGTMTARQQYIVAMLGETDTLAEAANRLGISPSALSARVRAITNRLGLGSPGELVALARRQQVLDASTDAIYGVAPDGTCVFANRQAGELLGHGRDALIGAPVHDLIHHTRPDGSPFPVDECPIMEAIRSQRTRSIGDDVFWHRDGSPVWVSYTVAPVGESDSGQGAVVTVRDVTPHVRTAEAVRAGHVSMGLALEAAHIATFELDVVSGTVLSAHNFETLVGLEPGSMSDRFDEFMRMVHPDDRGKLDLGTIHSAPAGTRVRPVFRFELPDGTRRWLRSRAQLISDGLGRPTRLVGVIADITDIVEHDEARRLVLDTSIDAFISMNRDGRVIEWNHMAEEIFGYSRDEAMGQDMAELIIPPGYREPHQVAIARIMRNPPAASSSTGPIEMLAQRAGGSEFPVEVSFTTVALGSDLTFTAFVRDISERKHMEQTLVNQVLTDQLTALPNRALLGDRMAQAVARLRPGRSMAVMFADVDHLKVVNDSLGHAAGDELLREVARRLRATVPSTGTVARFGGDTFAIVVDDVTEHEASQLAAELLAAFEDPMTIEERELRVCITIGIALGTDSSQPPEGLQRDADAAMYRAKEMGRARAEIFDSAMRQRAVSRLDLEGELRRAIDNDELRLHYQPVVDLATSRVLGVEALVRWEHPTRGLVPPAAFVPIAEETGLIVPIGDWVLRTATEQLASWMADTGSRGRTLTMAVNLSGRQLSSPDLVESVEATLARTGVHPSQLCLEITESTLMEESAGDAVQRLHDLGVRLAVDDFGTGYSSLLYLRRFPVDTLKLDRFFVSGLGRNAEDNTIVDATIGLAHALGLEALAEGVERVEQLDVLAAMGCDSAQGFLWSRPVPASEIRKLLLAGALVPVNVPESLIEDVGPPVW
jgi:diguanylate cyclase (GGDEF)-like protein/PAS domain S-box-containing protein